MIVLIKKIPILFPILRQMNRKRISYKIKFYIFFDFFKKHLIPNLLRSIVP